MERLEDAKLSSLESKVRYYSHDHGYPSRAEANSQTHKDMYEFQSLPPEVSDDN